MLKLEFRAKRFKIDKGVFEQKLRENVVKTIFKPAMKAFIEAAIRFTPVDTGMAAGAFLILSKEVGLKFPTLKRTKGGPLRTNRRYYDKGREGHRRYMSKELGSRLTIMGRSSSAAREGQELFRWEGNILRVRFDTTIRHFLALFEKWGNLEAGKRAFVAEMQKRRTKMPKIKGFIVSSEIAATHSGVYASGFVPIKQSDITK